MERRSLGENIWIRMVGHLVELEFERMGRWQSQRWGMEESPESF